MHRAFELIEAGNPRRIWRPAAVVTGVAVADAAILLGAMSGIALDMASVVAGLLRWGAIAGCCAATFGLWCRTSRPLGEAQAHDLQRIQLERQLVQTHLQALRNQIEPHFLFNTLATVRRLHQTEPAEGARLLT